jgi:branched-chain amino acid transport system ATP-binding protein
MPDPILTLSDVATDIAQYHILKGVGFEVPRGEVTVLLGRNGVGKTTTMRTIMGLWRNKAGSIRFEGAEIGAMPVSGRSRAGIGFVPEDMGIFTALSVEENMVLAASTTQLSRERLDWIFAAFPPLRTFWTSPAGNLSGGQKQMLSIARAMAEDRKLYLIDEPTKGLAPAIITAVTEALAELARTNTTLLLVEQNFAMARALGEAVVMMDDGRVVHRGAMAEFAADQALQARFMGLSLETHS